VSGCSCTTHAAYACCRSIGPAGTYGTPTNTEDDITIIGSTLPLLQDEAGNTAATAEPVCNISTCTASALPRGSTRKRAVVHAVANSGTDVDYYSFVACDAGPVSITVQYVTGMSQREGVRVQLPLGEVVDVEVTMAYRRQATRLSCIKPAQQCT
jgi:hypothetical protein